MANSKSTSKNRPAKNLIRKSRSFERYVSAVRNLMEEKLEFLDLPDLSGDLEEHRTLLFDIKEMLEDVRMGAAMSPTAALYALEERPLTTDEELALEAVKAAWSRAHELQNLLSKGSERVHERFIALLRVALQRVNASITSSPVDNRTQQEKRPRGYGQGWRLKFRRKALMICTRALQWAGK